MKYLVIGAGGTGGGIGGFLARAGKDVTLIARGAHLEKMRETGLRFETPKEQFSVPVNACTMDEYHDKPDIIFVCVKGYSLDDAVPFIQKVAESHTIVIPILNIYRTGKKLQELLPEIPVTDGCIYIASQIKEPGTILMSGDIFRVVYGLRRDTSREQCQLLMPALKLVENDLKDAGITPLLSSQIEKDALQKFSFVSPMAAIGAYYDITASAVQEEGQMRDTFISLIQEVKDLSDAMDVSLPDNIIEINLKIMDDLAPAATASMHRDIRAGRQSEIDGLIFEVIRVGKQYQVPTPTYEMIAGKFR